MSGASIKKQINGKTFWWCTGSDGKNHKQIAKSKGKKKNGQGQPEIGSSDIKPIQNAKGIVPNLKLNNSLATALAALTA